ncbi:hypothetical protein FQN60_007749 [Etheostoma spectabile]|uniref:PID domain-containing protein n=1 Tax=Etheostoma spectabile TaxID=54343 RepID=A0A5J5C7J0_9PERO|nr:hypothetical protein FQN60_007938 [Etheostoma spectabile]KAA8586180.1 hypothetical protein FQN60_007749 [Etheostoma spectabile]
MDALKSAGRAIIRSPSVAKQSWTAGRHRKLPENWTDTRETIVEGMTFNLRHLGMTLVDQPKGEELSAAAAKAIGKKPKKVTLKVSPRGIVLYDRLTNKLLENVSIYRISYCTVDKQHDKMFAYIAQNTLNGTLECHAYLCSKRKVAQAVALTVAQAFTKGKRVKSGSAGDGGSSSHSERSNSLESLKGTDNLLDFEDNVNVVVETNGNAEEDQLDNCRPSETTTTNNNSALEIEDGLDEAFSNCALDSYGSCPEDNFPPPVLDIGVTPQDWLAEPDWDSTNGNTSNALDPFGDDVFGF